MQAVRVKIPFFKGRSIQVREEILLFLGVLILGILLRLTFLGRWSLWTDELYTLRMANTASTLAEGIPQDQNPPLYDLMMRSWVNFWDCESEFCLRLPSAIVGIAAIPFMWMIGMTLGGKRLALFSTFLLATSPLHIWYSREARIYSLGVFATVCSMTFYLQVFRRGHWGYALGLVLTTLMGLYTTYSVLAIWILEIGFVLLLWETYGRVWRRLILWFMAQVAIILGTLPWIPFLKEQLTRSFTFKWPLPLHSILQTPLTATLEQILATGITLGALLILLMLIGSVFFNTKPRFHECVLGKRNVLAGVVVFLLAIIIVLGTIPRGLSVRRQLLVLLPGAILLGAWGLCTLKKRVLERFFLILAIVTSLYTILGSPYQDWRGVVGYIEDNIEPGEHVLLAPSWSNLAFDYYVDGFVNYEGISTEDLKESTNPFLSPGESVWLVLEEHPALLDFTQEVRGWFEGHAAIIQRESFPRFLVVTKYQIHP